jgi:transposase-like protein
MNECDIGQSHTAVDWSNFCREVAYDHVQDHQQPLGGPGLTVEIDESKFGRRKYNRGKRVEGQWVFGMIERESGRVVLEAVEKRDRATLLPIIKKWVLPGTRIMSDMWKSYDTLGDEGYTHLTVNHSIQFLNPDNGACTNRIESTWRAVKAHMPSSGRRKYFFPGYLAKYAFLKECKMQQTDPFVTFLKYAARLYPGKKNSPNPAVVQDQENIDVDDMESGEEI